MHVHVHVDEHDLYQFQVPLTVQLMRKVYKRCMHVTHGKIIYSCPRTGDQAQYTCRAFAFHVSFIVLIY